MMGITMKQIDRYVERIGKKRDEVRKLLGEMSPLVESLQSADEGMGETLRLLNEARDSLDNAVDKMSEYA